jgi:hypothetical protein
VFGQGQGQGKFKGKLSAETKQSSQIPGRRLPSYPFDIDEDIEMLDPPGNPNLSQFNPELSQFNPEL